MSRKNCSNNIEAFFALVRAGLWEENVELREYGSTDFDEVMRLAEEQSVVGLVTAGLEQVADVKVPQEMLLQFIGQSLQLEKENGAMNKFVAGLVEKMRNAGIYALLVKGQGIAQCYEKPLWRACGDVDFFLSEDNYQKAKDFLIPMASRVEEEYARERHLGMEIDGYAVELHGRLYCGLSSRIEKELDGVYQDTFYGGSVRSWDDHRVQIFLLTAENDAFYVFTHILQHFYKEGVGLRQICDWCRLLWTYREKLNRGLLESRIRKAGLMSEWKAFGAFAVEYLGMDAEAMPLYSPNKKWKCKANKVLSFVLEVGNFGHNRDKGYSKNPYVIRKAFSLSRRIGDLWRHARIFPMDSMRFLPYMVYNGVRSALRGE